MLALVALAMLGGVLVLAALGRRRSTLMLFGLPLGTALAMPVALPIFVLAMFWFAVRQGAEDERFPEDD